MHIRVIKIAYPNQIYTSLHQSMYSFWRCHWCWLVYSCCIYRVLLTSSSWFLWTIQTSQLQEYKKNPTKCFLYQEILQLIQHFQKVKNQHGIIFSHGGQYFPGLHDCDYLLHIKKLIKLCYIRSSEIWRGLDEQYNF